MSSYERYYHFRRRETKYCVSQSSSSSGGGHIGPPDRLINVHTMAIRSLDATKIPPAYAILSHTWSKRGEATLVDWRAGTHKILPGYGKIVAACRQARKDGLKYLWVDTCCIDKESSAEVGRAINSMYKWYERSAVCYAILEDVHPRRHRKGEAEVSYEELAKARWFTRGWTLQELLAPSDVRFFAADWTMIGSLRTILPTIAEITGIDRRALSHKWPISCFSTAQKFSWASQRKTTRPEDKAYCLIGLFDISLVPVYGIGSRAFQRLQEEIISQSYELDDSIFVWDNNNERRQGTLLATSLTDFKYCGNIERDFDRPLSSSFRLSGGRVNGNFWLLAHDRKDSWDEHCALLNCKIRGQDDKRLGLLIKRVEAGYKGSIDATYAINPKWSRRGSRTHRTVLIDEWRRQYAKPCRIEIVPDASRSRRERPIGTMSSHRRRVESMTSLSENETSSRAQSATSKRGRSRSSTRSRRYSSRHGTSRPSSLGIGRRLLFGFSIMSNPRSRNSSRRESSRTVIMENSYFSIRLETLETSRQLHGDEISAFSAFESHTRGCRDCRDPGEVLRSGYELCRTGQRLGDSVDSYAYLRRGKILSSESTWRRRVFLEVPQHYQQVLDYLHHMAG